MIGISTHVLDTSRGQPARGVRAMLERASGETWIAVGEGATDGNGRIAQLVPASERLVAGVYRLTFHAGEYFEGQQHFYPVVTVEFLVHDPATHYHVPLLMSPYGYTTYRGS